MLTVCVEHYGCPCAATKQETATSSEKPLASKSRLWELPSHPLTVLLHLGDIDRASLQTAVPRDAARGSQPESIFPLLSYAHSPHRLIYFRRGLVSASP